MKTDLFRPMDVYCSQVAFALCLVLFSNQLYSLHCALLLSTSDLALFSIVLFRGASQFTELSCLVLSTVLSP